MKQNTTRNLVVAGTVLFASTISIIYSDINRDRIKYKNELQSEIKLNEKLQNSYYKQHELLMKERDNNNELNKQIKLKSNEIHRLKQQLEKAKKRNELPTYKMTVTAFTAGYESTQKHKGDEGYGLTASGTYVKEGRTVACPKSFPFGTKIEIENVGIRVCEDRGQAITTGHIDLYMNSLYKAIEFGRKKLNVKILKKGDK